MKNILLLTLVFSLFAPETFYGQSKQTQKAKVDSSLVYIDASIKAIRKCCSSILSSPPYKYIAISSQHPMIINFNTLSDKITYKKEDYVSLGNFDNIPVEVFSKTSLTAIGNVIFGMDFSSGSFDGGGYIQSGEYEFNGRIITSGKQIYFENTKIRYEDDNSLWKLNEGAKAILDGEMYNYNGGTWISKVIK